jgi:hypothetical protein
MEFGKLQSLVELDLSVCSQVVCLAASILNLSRLKTFRLGVRQIDESTDEVRETSKLDGTGLIRMFPIGVFAWFNCGLVTTQDISIREVQQIDESIDGVRETSKLGETGLIKMFPIGVFTWFNCGLVRTLTISISGCDKLTNLPTLLEIYHFATVLCNWFSIA